MPLASPAATSHRLSRAQIRAELAEIFRTPGISDSDDIGDYFDGGPSALATFWDPLGEWPPFAARGLALSPSDLRFVATVGELVSVIDWGLRQAERYPAPEPRHRQADADAGT
jgi:hypothetical protein